MIRIPICIALFALLLSVPKYLNAQKALVKGFGITQKDSTRFEGFFDINDLNFNIIRYHATENGEVKSLLPGSVLRIEGESSLLILSTTIKTNDEVQEIFVTSVIQGEITLFEGHNSKGDDLYFLTSKEYPELRKINKHAPGAFLKTYFGTNCSINRSVRYNKWSLTQAINAYSTCLGLKNSSPVKRRKYKITLDAGPRLGYYQANPNVRGYFAGDYGKKVDGMAVGLDLQLNIMRRISLRTGVNYTRKTFTSEGNIESGGSYSAYGFSLSDPIKFSFSTIEIPVEAIGYLSKKWSVTPFIGLGINLLYSTKTSIEQNFTKPRGYFEPTIYSFTLDDVVASIQSRNKLEQMSNPFSVGFGSIRVGVSTRFKNHTSLEFSLRRMNQQENFNVRRNSDPADRLNVASGGYSEVKTLNRYDFSIAYYLPLIKSKNSKKNQNN